MHVADRKAAMRDRMRKQGLRPLEVWLPHSALDQIDAIKETCGFQSRNDVFLQLLKGRSDATEPAQSRAVVEDQLELRI